MTLYLVEVDSRQDDDALLVGVEAGLPVPPEPGGGHFLRVQGGAPAALVRALAAWQVLLTSPELWAGQPL